MNELLEDESGNLRKEKQGVTLAFDKGYNLGVAVVQNGNIQYSQLSREEIVVLKKWLNENF